MRLVVNVTVMISLLVTIGFIVVTVYSGTASAAKVVNFGSLSCHMDAVGCECCSDD